MSQTIEIIIEFKSNEMSLRKLKEVMYSLREILTFPVPGMTKELWEKYKPGNWALVAWVKNEKDLDLVKTHPLVLKVILLDETL